MNVRSLLPFGLALALSACFGYAPLQEASPAPARATPIRAYLRVPTSVPLTDATINNVVVVDGEFVSWEDGELTLSATWVQVADGLEHKAVGETVVLDSAQLDRVERRVLSAPRTFGLVGIGALASVLAGAVLTGGAGGSGNPPPPPAGK
jgi:hypothetical protein